MDDEKLAARLNAYVQEVRAEVPHMQDEFRSEMAELQVRREAAVRLISEKNRLRMQLDSLNSAVAYNPQPERDLILRDLLIGIQLKFDEACAEVAKVKESVSDFETQVRRRKQEALVRPVPAHRRLEAIELLAKMEQELADILPPLRTDSGHGFLWAAGNLHRIERDLRRAEAVGQIDSIVRLMAEYSAACSEVEVMLDEGRNRHLRRQQIVKEFVAKLDALQ
jgi:hypothetical protein